MRITVNGTDREVADGLTVEALLEQLGVNPATVVVERNRDILPRDQFGSAALAEGDSLELVRLVGGG